MARLKRGDIVCRHEVDIDFTTYYIFIGTVLGKQSLYNLVELDIEGNAVSLVQMIKGQINKPYHTLPEYLQNLISGE